MQKILLTLFMTTLSFVASANPACGAYKCLSQAQGTHPAECRTWRAPFFAIRIFTPYYNPPATAQARDVYLAKCIQANPAIRAKIRSGYGLMFADPGS